MNGRQIFAIVAEVCAVAAGLVVGALVYDYAGKTDNMWREKHGDKGLVEVEVDKSFEAHEAKQALENPAQPESDAVPAEPSSDDSPSSQS